MRRESDEIAAATSRLRLEYEEYKMRRDELRRILPQALATEEEVADLMEAIAKLSEIQELRKDMEGALREG